MADHLRFRVESSRATALCKIGWTRMEIVFNLSPRKESLYSEVEEAVSVHRALLRSPVSLVAAFEQEYPCNILLGTSIEVKSE